MEKKRIAELQWRLRKKQERRSILLEAAMEIMEEVMGKVLEVVEVNKERKAKRVVKATLLSTTSRLKTLIISSPVKRKATETTSRTLTTPSKRRRGPANLGEEEGWVRNIFEKLSLPGTEVAIVITESVTNTARAAYSQF